MSSTFSMSQPTSSQTENRPQIFVAHDGSPLPIFVESNGISDNRPRLIRKLRNHGANICSDISLARIILVEPHSSQGRQFVRDWGMDPGKIILEVAWVHRCLDAGRALLENDAWGGCGNLDGTPLDDDALDGDEVGLFTPRNAPSLSDKREFPSTSAPRRTSSATSLSNGRPSSALPTPRPTPVEYGASHSDAFTTGYDGSSSSQRVPTPPSTSSSGHFTPPSSQPQHIQTQLPPNLPPNLVPPYGQLVPQTQFPMGAMNPQMMQAFLMNNPEAAAMALNMMMQGMSNNGFVLPAGWQGQPPQFFMHSPPGFPMMQPPQSQRHLSMPPPDINGHHASAPGATHDPSPPVKVEHQSTPPPMDSGRHYDSPRPSMSPLPTFTAVDESGSDSPPPNLSILSQRGKKRSRDSRGLGSSKAERRSGSPSNPYSKRREKKRSSLSIEHTVKQRDPMRQERTLPIGIFTTRDGEPMSFFLQVQLRNRIELISQVRKNGGKMVSDLREATFIILDTQPGKERDQWMKVVKDLKRFALRPGFIEACINLKGIVEEDDFVVEPVKRVRKPSPRRKIREDSVETEDKNSPPPPSSQLSASRDARRSPTPPTGSPRILSGGRFAFTPEETGYILKLAEYLYRKNPDITNNYIATRLAKGAPTHSQASWLSMINKQYRSELERIRQMVVNEKRTTAAGGSEPEENQVEEALMQPIDTDDVQFQDVAEAAQPNGNGNNNNGQEYESKEEHSELYYSDVKTTVHFFANPPDGMIDDDALWAAITQAHTCQTAPTWQDFYQSNQEIVNERLQEALDMQEAKRTAEAL